MTHPSQPMKIGLEIHQQLGRPGDTKLFCHCPGQIIERQADFSTKRKLRASAGETGTTDAAAKAQAAKGKSYLYESFNDATCLVELDEEPPHPLNPETLKTAIMVAKACGSTILPQLQVMRKTIVDGSATAGFQRTGLLALGGVVPESEPQVRLQAICIEEDAAKIVTRTPEQDTYNLSRLGIPLIEISTEPDITSPQQAQEVAAQIGMLLRSTKRVKRGLGTIRQDLNISIPEGNRIEIKGAQDLRLIPTLIEYEVKRQQGLLSLKEENHKRKINDRSIDITFVDVTPIFRKSTTGFIKNALAKGDHAIGVKINGFAGLLGRELCPNYRVGTELADLAKAAGFGGLIHSDEDLKKYGLQLDAMKELHVTFATKEQDAFAVLIGQKERIELIFINIIERIKQFGVGIPKEVRKANPDGTTSFLRPMPGAARMYPETDIPIVHVKDVAMGIAAPKLMSEQVREIVKRTKISEEQAKELVRQGIPFEEYLERFPSIEPVFIATATLTYGKEILTRYKKDIDHLSVLEPLFEAVERKKISKEAVFEIMVEIAEGKVTVETINFGKYAQISDEEIAVVVRKVIEENKNASPNALMGKVMQQVRGKADGKRIMALIEQEKRALL